MMLFTYDKDIVRLGDFAGRRSDDGLLSNDDLGVGQHSRTDILFTNEANGF